MNFKVMSGVKEKLLSTCSGDKVGFHGWLPQHLQASEAQAQHPSMGSIVGLSTKPRRSVKK